MAQSSPNNLVVGIVVDASKAKADIKLFNAEIQKFTKELNAAVKAGNEAAAAGARGQIEQRYRLIEQTTAAWKRNTVATRENTAAHREHASSSREGARALAELAREAGFSVEGMRALKFGFGGLGLALGIRQITSATEAISDLVQKSKQIGFSTPAIQGWTKSVENANGTADDAQSALSGLSEVFAKTGKEAVESGKDIDNLTTTMHGAHQTAGALAGGEDGLATVIRGTKVTPPKFSDPLKTILGIDRAQFGSGEKEVERFSVAVARAIVRVHDTVSKFQADEATKALFSGQTFAQREKSIRGLAAAGSFEAFNKAQGIRIFTPEQKEAAERLEAAIKNVKANWVDLVATITASIPTVTNALDTFAGKLRQAADYMSGKGESGKSRWDEFFALDEFSKAANAIEKRYEQLVNAIHAFDEWLKATHDALWKGIGAGARALTQPGPGAVTDQGFAAGGYIRGSGTGTSDSIPARLSNGEFVLNAASVRRLGIGYLDALNNFAEGGLVSAPPIRFAEGGSVGAASSGTPIHLHIGGGTYPMSASSGVAAALVGAAKHSQMVSGGIKPSWYGR